MSVTAAQLVAEISISGADSGISNLTKIGAASDGAQAALDKTSNAASTFAEAFAGVTSGIVGDNDMMLASYEELASAGDSALVALSESATTAGAGLSEMGIEGEGAGSALMEVLIQISQNVRDVEASVQGMSSAVTGGLDDLYTGFSQVGEEAQVAGEEIATTGESASHASGGFMNLFNQVGQSVFWFQNLINMGQQVGNFFLGSSIKAEETVSSLQIFTGSAAAAQKELQSLSDFASHTPFETQTIDDAALKLQAVGINAKDVIPDILALGDALDATGRITSADLAMIVNDFSKIKTEGHLTTDVMNSFALQGIDAWSVLEKQTGKTHAELAKLISSGLYPADKAMKDLTEGIEKNPLYKGQMANDVNNFTGAVSTMKSNFEGVLVQFGSPILKAIEPVIQHLSDTFSSQGFKDFAGSIGQGIANVFKDIAGFIGTVGPPAQRFAEALGDVGKVIGNNLAPAFGQLNTVFAPFAGFFAHISDLMPKAKAGFHGLYDDLGPLAPFFKALVDGSKALGDALSGLGKNKEVTGFLASMRDGFSQVQKIVGGELGKDFQQFGQIVQQVGTWFKTDMWPAIQQAMPGFEHLASVIATTVVPALAKIWAVGQQVMRDVMPPLTKAFETIAPIVVRVGGFLADNLGKALQFIMPFAVQAAQSLGQFAGEITSRVQPIVEGIYSTIKIFLDWIAPYWPQIWGQIKNDFTAVWDIIKGAIQIAWSIVSGTIKVGLDLFSGNWKQAWKDIQDAFGGAWDGIKSIVSGVWTAIGGSVKGGINAVIDMINGFIRGIDSIHVNVAGVNIGFNVPTIPHLATGGRLTRGGVVELGEEGSEQVYLPAGAEVMPHGQSFGGYGGQQPIIVQAILEVDGMRMSNGLLPHIVTAIRAATGVRF